MMLSAYLVKESSDKKKLQNLNNGQISHFVNKQDHMK